MFIGGTYGGSLLKSTEVINPDKTAVLGTYLLEDIQFHCMVTLHDGRIMIIGIVVIKKPNIILICSIYYLTLFFHKLGL